MRKAYIGDGVYIEIENGMFKLTAESGGQMNVIYLEAEVYEALTLYVKKYSTPPDEFI